jgi:4-hydroxy-2-oxoheptanedioate aldolase
MRPNHLREIWARGDAAINGWLNLPGAFSAEVMAHQGFDSLTIDIQHGLIGYETAVGMLQAISTTDTVPVVRVPWLEPGILMKVLDAGAYGVICPMVNSAEEAENLVAWTRYPPMGTRSNGPVRANLYGGADYQPNANDTVVTFAMIETADGLDNLDEILKVPGYDATYIGPTDLSLALGCKPTFDDVEKPVAEAIEFILRKTREAGKIAGCHNGSPEWALKRIEMGFQFVTIGADMRLLAASAKKAVDTMRGAQTKAGDTGGY